MCHVLCHNMLGNVMLFLYVKKSDQGKSNKKSNTRSFSEIVQDSHLWSPGKFNTHADWISTLTSAIIDSGVIQDEVFQSLSQMCNVHVSVFNYQKRTSSTLYGHNQCLMHGKL